MKKFVQYSLTFVVATQALAPQFVLAQQPVPSVGIVGGVGGGTTGFLSAGDYNINRVEASYTEALQSLVANNNRIQQQDREFLQSKGKLIGDAVRELVEKRRQMVALGQKASTTVTVKLDEVLALSNDINALIEKIRIDIQEASIINTATLPSATMSVGNVQVTSGPGSVINIAAAFDGFTQTIERLYTEINQISFRSVTHKDITQPIAGNVLSPDLSAFPQMSQTEIEAALLEIARLSVISRQTQELQQVLNDQIVESIKTYVEEMGTEEFLRFRNDNDRSAKLETYRAVEKLFFMKSYLRRKYGLQIGAIRPANYPTLPAHLENFTRMDLLLPMRNALSQFNAQGVRMDADLMKAFNDARQWVEKYDEKLTPILSATASANREEVRRQIQEARQSSGQSSFWSNVRSMPLSGYRQLRASFASREEVMSTRPVILNDEGRNVAYSSQDTGIMARVSGGATFLTGQTSTVESLLAVMRLVLADIREEVMLSQGDWSQLQTYHQQRFMSSPQQTERTVTTMCQIDQTLSPAARERAAALTNGRILCRPASGGLVGGTITGPGALATFRNLISHYDRNELARAQRARNLRVLVDQSMQGQTQEGDRADDSALFSN